MNIEEENNQGSKELAGEKRFLFKFYMRTASFVFDYSSHVCVFWGRAVCSQINLFPV